MTNLTNAALTDSTRIDALKARRTKLLKDLEVAESGEYDWAESERVYGELVEGDNAIASAEMTDKQLRAGWPNGPASAQRAIAAEKRRRGIFA